MFRLIYRVTVPIILLLVWLIINESATLTHIISGVVVTSICLFVTNRLLGYSYKNAFFLPPIRFVVYLVFLLKKIYLSGIKATGHILKGDVSPCFIATKIDSELKNVYLHDILATSITLTPGTITIDNKDKELTVLSMYKDNPATELEHRLLAVMKGSQSYGPSPPKNNTSSRH